MPDIRNIAMHLRIPLYNTLDYCIEGFTKDQINKKIDELEKDEFNSNVRAGVRSYIESDGPRDEYTVSKACILYDRQKSDSTLKKEIDEQYSLLTTKWDSLYYKHREFENVDQTLFLLEKEFGYSPRMTSRLNWIEVHKKECSPSSLITEKCVSVAYIIKPTGHLT